jgi:hypothetical protein
VTVHGTVSTREEIVPIVQSLVYKRDALPLC